MTAEQEQFIEAALSRRTTAAPERRQQLASSYIAASIERAVATTTSTEPPPTAMKSSQLALLNELLAQFGDVPTPGEIAALLRVTPSAAKSLLVEILATSDTASEQLLTGVFGRAENTGTGNQEAPVPNGSYWRFASSADFQLARGRLEFLAVNYRTVTNRDGVYVLVVDPNFEPDA